VFEWPGIKKLFSHYSLFGFKKLSKPLEDSVLTFAFIQLFFYFISIVFAIFYVLKSIKQTLETDSEKLTKFTAYIIRSSFWAVLIVGIADLLVSFMVVEKLAEPILGEFLKIKLVIPNFRITFVHFPLILISFVIGYFTRPGIFDMIDFFSLVNAFIRVDFPEFGLPIIVIGMPFFIMFSDKKFFKIHKPNNKKFFI
jgi:hypothetical protein